METLETNLKAAYNAYIDALSNYLKDIKLKGIENNGLKYILDNHFSVWFRDSYELVQALESERLLNKKVL